MKVDIDEIERKARAATRDQWQWGKGGTDGRVNCLYVSDPSRHRPVIALDVGSLYLTLAADTDHIAANSPPVTLAIIARIRKLEAIVQRAACCLQASSDKTARREWAAGLLEDLTEGIELP